MASHSRPPEEGGFQRMSRHEMTSMLEQVRRFSEENCARHKPALGWMNSIGLSVAVSWLPVRWAVKSEQEYLWELFVGTESIQQLRRDLFDRDSVLSRRAASRL